MVWHLPKALISTMPVDNTLDLTVGIITSEHGEVELMPPCVFANRKQVMRLAKRLAKDNKKGGPIIHPDSDVVSLVPRTRVNSDRWPMPPRSL